LCIALFAASSLRAETADSFLQAYFAIQNGDAEEKGGNGAKAAEQYVNALKILRAIKAAAPDWNPNIIAYRIRYCTDHITKNGGNIPPEEATPSVSVSIDQVPKPPINTVPAGATPVAVETEPTPEVAPATTTGGAKGDRVAALERALEQSKTELRRIQDEKKDLEARLKKAEKEAKGVTSSSDERVQELLKENGELKEKLTQAEAKVKEVASSSDEIKSLKEELAKTQTRLESLQKENEELKAGNEAIKKELEETKTQLKTAAATGAAPAKEGAAPAAEISPDALQTLQKENSLLRAIVDRHYQEDAKRTEVRDKVAKALQELGERASTLQAQLEVLQTPLVPLTAEEKQLLKTPPGTLRIVTEDTTKLSGVVKAASPEDVADPQARLNGTNAAMASEARSLFEKNDIEGAAAKYEKILETEANSVFALSNLGVIRFRQERLQEAEKLLRKALSLAPKDGFSMSVLGIVLYQERKYDDAVSILTQAVAMDPKNAEPHNYLGIAYSQKGYQEAAEKELLKAVEIKPDYADAHFNLAVIFASQDPPSIELARKHYKKAVACGMKKDPELEKLLK
jgi:tetratricopeptide (TPR) repeat protein